MEEYERSTSPLSGDERPQKRRGYASGSSDSEAKDSDAERPRVRKKKRPVEAEVEVPKTLVKKKKKKAEPPVVFGADLYVAVDPYLDEIYHGRQGVHTDSDTCFPCEFLEKKSVNGEAVRKRFKNLLASYGYLSRRTWTKNVHRFFEEEYRAHNAELPSWGLHEIITHITCHGQTPHINVLRQEINDLDAMILMHKKSGIVLRDSITGVERLDPAGIKLYLSLVDKRILLTKLSS